MNTLKLVIASHAVLAIAGCKMKNDPFEPISLTRMEMIQSQVGQHREANQREIESLRSDITLVEFFEVFGTDSLEAPDIPFFFVIPRAGYPQETKEE